MQFTSGLLFINFITVIISFIPLSLWLEAKSAEVNIPFMQLLGMKMRGVDPKVILSAMIKSCKAGLQINSYNLEAHFLARGNVDKVVKALIAAKETGIEYSYHQACAMDLAGKDIMSDLYDEIE